MIKVFYRLSPFLSSNPNPLGTDKQQILERCYWSFREASGDAKIIILNDSCQDLKFLRGDEEVIDCSGLGNVGTYYKQLDLVCDEPDNDKVMLVEDDYLWLQGSVVALERALDVLPLISPYDHTGHYTEERFQQPKVMKLIENHTYRSAPSNTLTFACKAWVIKQNRTMMKMYGIRDHDMFTALPVEMFVPVPSFATHLVTGLLAPNVEWKL